MPRVGGPRLGSPRGGGAPGDFSGSEDEQAVAGANAVFERYLETLEDDVASDQVFSRGMARVRAFLNDGGDASACLICLGGIGQRDAVWSCRAGCHAVFHMQCIQEWARNQVDQHVLRTMNKLSQFPGAAAEARANAEWGCPKCRQAYHVRETPTAYLCFCGKVSDPEWDPWRAPHSCGELCGRRLNEDGAGCDHTCLLLCHPGPCPPCPLVVDASCYCGRVHDRKRCGHHEFACGGTCAARLDCGHTCPVDCHPGECPPCERPGTYACACGAEKRQLRCCERFFQCTRVCGKPLACGRHMCEKVCHAGPCGGCPFEGVRTCPCGKATYPELTCTEKAPTCGGTCGKVLPCGRHTCQERCHPGECASCRAVVAKTCRCGKMTKEMTCGAELLCDRRCTNTRACGRHPCKRRCCDGESCPPCDEVCGRKLRCGNHRCPAPCHSGPCLPCPLTVSFTCACGSLESTLPCGTESRALAPRCYGACPVPSLCRHPHLSHRCHFGPCPPCSHPCGTPQRCGHTCGSQTCHDPAPPAIPEFAPPAAPKKQLVVADMEGGLGGRALPGSTSGPAAAGGAGGGKGKAKGAEGSDQGQAGSSSLPPAHQAAAKAKEIKAGQGSGPISPCPACIEAVVVGCLGGHEQKSVPCSTAGPYSCGRSCGRPLSCGNHMCSLACHAVQGAAGSTANSAAAAMPCEVCTRPCGKQRGCAHPCDRSCHKGPCPECLVQQRVACHCGKSSLSHPCVVLQHAKEQAGKDSDPLCCGKPCHRQLAFCPHPCRALCHPGACPKPEACAEEVTVRCECKRQRAKWPCSKVQAALVAAGRPQVYDATTPLRLLACTDECAKAKAAGLQPPKEDADAAEPGSSTTTAAAAASKQQAAGATSGSEAEKKVGSRHLSKAERAALAEKREAERAAAERRRKLRGMLVWAVIVGLGVLLGLVLPLVLKWLDNRAQAKWGRAGPRL